MGEERLTAAQAKQHPFVIKYHGRVAAAAGNCEELGCRPSIEARWLQRNKEVLEGEMLQILRAKSTTEQKLLSLTEQLGDKYRELQHEQSLRKAAEALLSELKEKDERQAREREELMEQMQM